MSVCLRAGQTGLLREQQHGTAAGPSSRGRARFSTPTGSALLAASRSVSAPPTFGLSAPAGSKRQRRAVSESPRPCARLASPCYGGYRAGTPVADRKRSPRKSVPSTPARRAGGMRQAASLFGTVSSSFLGAPAQTARNVSLAVSSLLSPASVGNSQESDLLEARTKDLATPAGGGVSQQDDQAEETAPRSPQINPSQLRQESLTGTVRVRLTVRHPQPVGGMQLKAIGNRRALGSWNPAMAADFEDRGDGVWCLDTVVPPGLLRFKLVMQAADGTVMAEKGIRKVEVPSGRLAQTMPSCYFNVSCTWGAPAQPVVQAARLPAAAHERQIQSAEQQVARLRERQAKLQARMMDLSSQIKQTNSQITRIHEGVQSAAAQEVALRQGSPSTSGASESRAAAPAAPAPRRAKQPRSMFGLFRKEKLSRPIPTAPPAAPQDVESLFDHPSWSGKPKAAPSAAVRREQPRPAAQPVAAAAAPVSEPASAAPVPTRAPLAKPASPIRTVQGSACQARQTPKKDIFRSAECPAILLTGGAILSAHVAGHIWRGMRSAIPEEHRQTAGVVGAVAAAAVLAAIVK